MPDILTTLSIFAGFAFVIVVGAKLGAGGTDSVIGLFRFEDMPPRPHGVQETDLPRFVFRDSKSPASGAA
jgi:hypothetical protein